MSLMKKICLLLITAGVLLSSCQKADEYLNKDALKASYLKNGYLENKPNAEIKECQIVQISYPVGSTNDVLQFTYNSLGDPVTITRLLGPSTGHPNFVFKYDQKNRLTDFVGTYSNNNAAEFWHKYFYDNQNNIVLDSTYIFPRITNGFPENAYSSSLTYYTYDNKRRIIKDSTVFANTSNSLVHDYSYDQNGNRMGNNYDDKINLNRTSTIWMFLNRDFSVNNSLGADSYNEAGLPLNINSTSEQGTFVFLGNFYQTAQILYNCNSKTKATGN